MAQTGSVVIDGDTTPDPIIADIYCDEVLVFSDENTTTGGYYRYQPSSTSTPVFLSEGVIAQFKAEQGKQFQAGAVVGYMKTVNAGPFTLNKICQ